MSDDERRESKRHSVFAGNAEITEVFGRGRKPSERARIVNWSRGGVLLKVLSPTRKMLFMKCDPVLFESDDLQCTIRLAPAYKEIQVRGEVCHVASIPKDPNHVLVGVKFDSEETKPNAFRDMAAVLEPRSRSGRLSKISAANKRVSSRLEGIPKPKKSARLARKSKRLKRESARVKSESAPLG
jgi:hypothetical protein